MLPRILAAVDRRTPIAARDTALVLIGFGAALVALAAGDVEQVAHGWHAPMPLED